MNHDTIKEHIHTLIEKSGFSSDEVVFTYDEKTNTLWFALPGTSARLLLGRGAEALSALNHLASKIVEQLMKDDESRPRVVIDAGDFEKKKIDNLRTIAHMMAERARYFKSSVSVDPMPAHERRIVHEFLSDLPDIETESEGAGKFRHVVIRYKDSRI